MQNQDRISDECDDDGPLRASTTSLPAEQADGPGLHLMQHGDLEAAIGTVSGGIGDWEDGGATSREEVVRLQMLARYRDDPDALWRRYLVAGDATIGRLSALARGAANMTGAIEVVRRAAVISRHTQTPLRVPPLILVGPPGTGKTRIAGLIASALGSSSRLIAGTSIQDPGPLVGYGPAWRGAGPGLVAKAMLACPTASPVLVVDEAEKIAYTSGGCENPLDCILGLLEPTTAASFRDNFLNVPMRAENILWLFCVNNLAGLSRPLLDRCVVVDVPELSGDARRRAVEDLVVDTVLDHGVAPATLDDESLEALDGVGLRRARAVVTAALAGALEGGRDWPSAADFRAAAALLGGERPCQGRRPTGFIHF